MNGNAVKVSIVVPVHNVAPYLRACLDSLVGQTLKEIEILCVDDASQDESPAILSEYAQNDGRVRVIRYPENRSASQARKDGVLAAGGKYVMFLDADDHLELNACEELYGQIEKHGVEILHFAAQVTSVDNATAARISAIEHFIQPHPGRLEGRAVFEACFRDGIYGFTLWNKMYSADLCKRAFAHVPDGSFPKAQDLLAFFVLAYFARSYVGLETPSYHHYRFGSGITGRSEMTLEQFTTYCAQNRVSRAIRQFLIAQGEWDRYQTEHDKLHRSLLGDCAWNWQARLAPADRPRGFDILAEQWGAADAVAGLALRSWEHRADLARALRGARTLENQKKPIRTVGTYYHWISNGGVQRVIAGLIPLWQELGYAVVLFTDAPPSADDYELPPGVRRVVLPSWRDTNADNYHLRAAAWERTLSEQHIDVMVYHAWASKTLFWDLLMVKSQGIPFVVNTHSVFSFYLTSADTYFAEMPAIYSLCDAVTVLSRVDRRFWSHFVPGAFYLPNPLTFEVKGLSCSKLDNQDVLWVGRFSREKCPMDAIRIMARVVQSVPSARLLMLGAGPDEELNSQIRSEIEILGLQDQVVLCGYHLEVGPFYGSASVYLSTSRYEGFNLALAEAKSHGLPCVMYAIPHLELVRDGQGIRAVAQGDVDAAADQIVKLLRHADERRQLGVAARQSMEKFAEFDLAAGWREVLEHVARRAPAAKADELVDETSRIMMETLFLHFNQGRDQVFAWKRKGMQFKKGQEQLKLKLEANRVALREARTARRKAETARKKSQAREKALLQSWTWKAGRALLVLPDLLWAAIKRCGTSQESRRPQPPEPSSSTGGTPE